MVDGPKDRLYRLLRWSERYTRIDMVYFASGSFWAGVGLASNAAASFCSALLFGNLLPKDSYGIYKYILSIASILGNLSLTGLRTALNRSAALNYDGDLRRGFWLSIRWSVLLTFASYALALYYFSNGNFAIGAGILIFGTLAPLLNAANLYAFYLNGAQRFRQENFYSIGRDWLPLVCIIPTLLLTSNIILISLVYFASNTASALLFYWSTVRQIPIESKTSPALVSYSAHLSAMALLAGVVGQMDNILVFHYLGAAELAVYSFASAIPGQFQNAFKTLYTLALPKFSNKDRREAKHSTFIRLGQVILLGLACSIAYAALAPYFFAFFFPKYIDAVGYTQLLAITILLSGTGSIMSAYFDSQQEVRKKYVITIFSNVSKLFLMAILMRYFGIPGIIFGIIISWFLTLLLQFVLIAAD